MAPLRRGIFALAAVYACFLGYANAQDSETTDASADASAELNGFGGGSSPLGTCRQIAAAVSRSSQVFYPPSPEYDQGIRHWASSSTQNATCVVQPGTSTDVGKILQIVGNRGTPFAVKGGGHTSNVGYSSTTGVQIAMSRFNAVSYNSTSGTAEVGAGLIWDDVYAALEPYGVNVVGGRVSGVGVAGFTLGGGYGWRSNQFGLTIDTVTEFELVLPNGSVKRVTERDGDLFFGLKGGFNNFGVVTKFVMKAFPQTQVYGGFMVFGGDKYPQILAATEKFTNGAGKNDPKASMIINISAMQGLPISTVQMFYDAPTAPAGTFDDFLSIPEALAQDVGTRSFLSFVQATPGQVGNFNGLFQTVSTTGYDTALLGTITNELFAVSQQVNTTLQSGFFYNYAIEPFHPSLFSYASDGSSAYPPTRSQALFPLNLFFAWTDSAFNNAHRDAITSSASRIEQVAAAQGLLPGGSTREAWLYGNYAINGTPLERIYGGNLGKLSAARRRYDPRGVMALAGGWKF